VEDKRLSDEGIKFLKKHEGVIYKVYDDGVGYLTAGVGHKLTESELENYDLGCPIEEYQVDLWLRQDSAKAVRCVNNWVTTDLTQTGFDMLVSFVFNVGCDAFKRSTLLKKLNRGDVMGAAAEFNRWVFAQSKKLPGLVARREEEKKLFLEAEDPRVMV